MHRDIKVSNIFLTDSDINITDVKIGDFGFSTNLGPNLAHTQIGTPLYMAPEIFKGELYDNSVDIWSLGILLYELLHGYSPFKVFI